MEAKELKESLEFVFFGDGGTGPCAAAPCGCSLTRTFEGLFLFPCAEHETEVGRKVMGHRV